MLFFFIGNDFLPRIYCFDIKRGNLDNLIKIFKKYLKTADNYINDDGIINWNGMEKLLNLLAKFEYKFMRDRLIEFENIANNEY